MTHEQLVENVARAICDDDHKGGDFGMMGIDAWESPRGREVYIARARAAIAAIYEAMREPSEAIQKKGLDALAKAGATNLYGWAAGDCYRAMIEASPLKGE